MHIQAYQQARECVFACVRMCVDMTFFSPGRRAGWTAQLLHCIPRMQGSMFSNLPLMMKPELQDRLALPTCCGPSPPPKKNAHKSTR